MRENYLKSFFKAYGLVSVIVAVLAFVFLGIVSIRTDLVSATIANILTGAVIAALGGVVLISFSGLKNEKVGFADYLRIVALIASIVLLIVYAVKDAKTIYVIGYGVIVALAVVEIIFRFIFCHGTDEAGFKFYFGALAGKYNPLIILVVGAVLAFVCVILAKIGITNKISFLTGIQNFKYAFLGVGVALIVVVLISGLDKNTGVTFLDLIFAVLFVTNSYLVAMIAPNGLVSSQVALMVVMLAAVSAAGLLVRGIFFSNGKGYTNPAHKVRSYFKSVYDKYDVLLSLALGVVVVVCVIASCSTLYASKDFIVNKTFKFSESSAMVFAIVALVIGVIGVILTLIFRKFKSQSVVLTDYVLVGLMYASVFVVVYCLSTMFFADLGDKSFLDETGNLLLLIGYGVILVYTLVIQFIRLKNFDAIQDVVTAAPQKTEEEAAPETTEVAPDAENEPILEEKEENADPFALTEEDEALFNSYYGITDEDAKEEEAPAEEETTEEEAPAEEEVVEEVVEEEVPAEEEIVEEVVEEEAPAEEAVTEEVPAEEATEEAEEEEAEEEEEPEEEEEAEEEAEEEPADGEEVEPLETHKEQNIVVQDFQVVDENGEPRKIKRKFLTKMMFAPYETKEFYNEIKNYLGLYRAKGRQSSRCESFRYKGLVAKVALGGKSVKVFLAIDPSFIDENPKYHLKDVSEKKQYAEVPVMMKVRSARGLKYFKELVDYMFATRGVKPKRNYENTDYLPSLIPNGEAILATLGMSTYYLQDTMNAKGIPDEMPDNLEEYLPMIPGDELGEEEVEAVVYLDTLCNHFEDGNEVTIDVLKSLHIVTRGNVLRIKARGTLDKKLIVYAEYFDEDALKMLMCTNCTAVKVVR